VIENHFHFNSIVQVHKVKDVSVFHSSAEHRLELSIRAFCEHDWFSTMFVRLLEKSHAQENVTTHVRQMTLVPQRAPAVMGRLLTAARMIDTRESASPHLVGKKTIKGEICDRLNLHPSNGECQSKFYFDFSMCISSKL
jgi:hypothetical protein